MAARKSSAEIPATTSSTATASRPAAEQFAVLLTRVIIPDAMIPGETRVSSALLTAGLLRGASRTRLILTEQIAGFDKALSGLWLRAGHTRSAGQPGRRAAARVTNTGDIA